MTMWYCEYRTTVSGKVEADNEREALRQFNEALEGLDLGAGNIQEFKLERSRSGYATEVMSIEPKPTRRPPPWRANPTP
ncbi:MAG: hypothetical protein H7338_23550 [Candidatus Sericytochromatia bacterium]|nr:hypothetical protein [Candidatus Sericytochromatia bacterium]